MNKVSIKKNLLKNEQEHLIIDKELYLVFSNSNWIPQLLNVIGSERIYLREWLTWVDAIQSLQDARKVIMHEIQANLKGEKLSTYIIYKGDLVGAVGLIGIDKVHKVGEIGYWLQKEKQGQGIMTKSVRRLIDYVFKETDLERLEIRIIPENKKSSKIPLRLGFTYEGKLRSAVFFKNRRFDFDIYGLLRKEYSLAR